MFKYSKYGQVYVNSVSYVQQWPSMASMANIADMAKYGSVWSIIVYVQLWLSVAIYYPFLIGMISMAKFSIVRLIANMYGQVCSSMTSYSSV